ncbi:hypothetical protein BDR05DRAFT_968024 [Suillus weaverae]|nr:hypothetical protein BDR05DRAFT_968024 [Suillus weaverae]
MPFSRGYATRASVHQSNTVILIMMGSSKGPSSPLSLPYQHRLGEHDRSSQVPSKHEIGEIYTKQTENSRPTRVRAHISMFDLLLVLRQFVASAHLLALCLGYRAIVS